MGVQMKVGFIGLGNVGSKLSASLLRNGVHLTVHDLESSVVDEFVRAGAKEGKSPERIMEMNDVVITCLPNPKISNEVVKKMLPHISEGKIWMEMSTTDEREVNSLGNLVTEAGGRAVDCPVSGGCHRADTGNISIFAGCDRETFEIVLPLLTIMGRSVLHTGSLGSASVLKVITNYMATANLVSCCEALSVAKASGLDLNVAYEGIKISSGNSFVHETESQVILNGSRNINFTMDLVAKDIGLFQEVAERLHVPVELNRLLIRIFQDGIQKYGKREFSPNIIKRLEEATGLTVKAPGFPSEIIDDESEELGAEIKVI